MADPQRQHPGQHPGQVEPDGGAPRHTRVLRLPMLLSALLLVGCGSAPPSESAATSSSPSPSPSPSSAVCTPPAGTSRETTALTSVDLDGDGTPDPVARTGAGDPCPGQLVAKVGDGEVAVTLPGPPIRSALGVAVPGRTGRLVVTRQDHPRGGFQTRVFALEKDALVQLESDGGPLVPFVATDVQEQPVSIDCVDGGVTVTRAVAHEPPGVAFAWDVRRTTYAFEGGTLSDGTTEEIADNVLPARLRTEYPELVKLAVFPSCRVPAANG